MHVENAFGLVVLLLLLVISMALCCGQVVTCKLLRCIGLDGLQCGYWRNDRVKITINTSA